MKTAGQNELSCRSSSNRVLIVTGTPGVGKSSVSELLASKIDAKLLSLGYLVKKEGLHIGVDQKRDTLIADLQKISEKVEKITVNTVRDIVIEGHYAVDVVSPEKTYMVFVLRRDPKELRDVLEGRGYKDRKVQENLAAEILDVCLYGAVKTCGANKVCEVDITGRKVEDAVEAILLILDGKKECKVGLVDWLGSLESEGKLDEYLKEF